MLHIPSVLSLAAPSLPIALPLILDSPHSGREYPNDFKTVLPSTTLIRGEDRHLDWLFANSTHYGAYFLQAYFPRSYIDPNRAIDDLDSTLFESGNWSEPLYPSEKTQQGYGLIWRFCPPGLAIYNRLLSRQEVILRIENYWQPYQSTLKNLYDHLQGKFGCVFHINCHSMPSAAVGIGGADIVLGNRNGTSCSPALLEFILQAFEHEGFSVAINEPYSGAYLISAYANKQAAREAVQIEVNRALYMNENNCCLQERATDLRLRLEAVITAIASYVSGFIKQNRLTRYSSKLAGHYEWQE